MYCTSSIVLGTHVHVVEMNLVLSSETFLYMTTIANSIKFNSNTKIVLAKHTQLF